MLGSIMAMIDWGVETLIAVTLLVLLVLLVRTPITTFLGARWAYALWVLPALRLILPPLPFLHTELVSPMTAFIPALGETAAPLPSSGGPGQWVPILLALWAGGAAAFILWQWLSYRRFVRQLSAEARPAVLPSIGGVPILESAAAKGPLAIGILKQRIVVPLHFEQRYSPAERQLALEHELIHHRRGDLKWNLLALFILALNWFNPVAWLGFRAFRTDQELACDAAIARRAPERLHDYATALVKSASRPGLVAACPLNHADQLKRRLKMMKHHRVSTFRTFGGAAAFGGLLLGGLGLSAPGFAQEAAAPEKKVMAKRIDKDGNVTIVEAKELAQQTRNCPEANRMMSSAATDAERPKTGMRVVICSVDGKAPTPEVRDRLAAALEKAAATNGGLSELSPERRTEVMKALQGELERARSRAKN